MTDEELFQTLKDADAKANFKHSTPYVSRHDMARARAVAKAAAEKARFPRDMQMPRESTDINSD